MDTQTDCGLITDPTVGVGGPTTFVASSDRYSKSLKALQECQEGDPNVDALIATHEEARGAVLKMLVERIIADLERCGNTDVRDGTVYEIRVWRKGRPYAGDYTLSALLLDTLQGILD